MIQASRSLTKRIANPRGLIVSVYRNAYDKEIDFPYEQAYAPPVSFE